MGVPEGSQEAVETPDPADRGFATLNTLRYAMKKPWPYSSSMTIPLFPVLSII